MAAWNPDGYFISNGPGDPSVMDYAIETVKKALDSDKAIIRNLPRSSVAGVGQRYLNL